MSDEQAIYRDNGFKGSTLIKIGLLPYLFYFALSFFGFKLSEAPNSVELLSVLALGIGTILYLTGYWQAVVYRASPKVGTEENAKSHSMTLVAFNLGIR